MNRLISVFAAAIACLVLQSAPSTAAEMTFQLVNDTNRTLNMKLFSRGESHQQWPSKTTAYSVKPDAAPQQFKITCAEGEQICWGAWMTVQNESGQIGGGGHRATSVAKYTVGAGDRGTRSCTRCCHVCKDGAVIPTTKLRDPAPNAD